MFPTYFRETHRWLPRRVEKQISVQEKGAIGAGRGQKMACFELDLDYRLMQEDTVGIVDEF